MNRDTWVGIVGAVILVGAMVAVFQYERTVGAERAGIGAGGWEIASLAGPSKDGRTTLGETSEETITLNQTGLVNVTFTLSWTAGQGTDTLTLAVTPPPGVDAPAPVTSDSGTATVTVAVPNDAPAGAEAGTLGVGDWKVRVTFDSATSVLPPPAPPVGGDGNVGWTVSVALDAYERASS